MKHASVFVLSSQWEGLPTVLVEALALGIPVVSTDCPSGPKEILNNGEYGRLVTVGDQRELAQSIKAAIWEGKKKITADSYKLFQLDIVLHQYEEVLFFK